MADKQGKIRVIDQDTGFGGYGEVQEVVTNVSPPRYDAVPAPTGLTVTGQSTYRAASTPMIAVALQWLPPESGVMERYIVEYATSVTGSELNNPQRSSTFTNTATLILNPNTLYYFRVAGVSSTIVTAWSSVISTTTIQDTTIPPDPTSMLLEWSRGDLLITVPLVSGEIVKDVRLRIYNQAQSILYKEIFTAAPFLYTADENRRLTGNNPAQVLTVVAANRSWSNVISTGSLTQTTTSPAPSGITGLTTTWAGDTGRAAADVLVTWNAAPNASEYVIQFNNSASQQFITPDNRFNLTWAANAALNPPSGLASLPIRVWGRNKIGQSGTLQSTTAVNAAPDMTGATVQATPGFSAVAGRITHAQIDDLYQYEWRLVPASGVTITYRSATPEITLPIPSEQATYTLQASIVDRFGQIGSFATSSPFVGDFITISGLRAAAIYTDSQGTAEGTLAGLKNEDFTTGVITHNNTTASSRWTQFERPLIDRYEPVTLAVSGDIRLYYRTSTDNNTFRYFAAPVISGRLLTEYGTQANAETNYISVSGVILTRHDFPGSVEARYIRMFHWAAAGSYSLREYYPRRLVQSDDIEAETIRAINIGAGQVQANHISVISLSAVNASTGNLTISGVLSIAAGTGSGLYQGTGTFASPTTGLKIWRDTSGIGRLTTFSGGTTQVDINTGGQLTAGGGKARLDSTGLNFAYDNSVVSQSSIRWLNGATEQAYISMYNSGGTPTFNLSTQVAGSTIYLDAKDRITLQTNVGGSPTAGVDVYTDKVFMSPYAISGNTIKNRTDANRAFVVNNSANATYIELSSYGTEKWLVGTEFVNSDRFTIYNSSVGGAIYIAKSTNYIDTYSWLGVGGSPAALIGFGGTSSGEAIYSDRTGAYSNQFGINFQTNSTIRGAISNGGNFSIGFGTPSSTTRLIVRGATVDSTANAFVCQASTGTNILIVRNDGASNQIWSNWTLISAQDEKERITDGNRGLADILQLRPRRYAMRRFADAGNKYHGFLAEEMERVMPELVDEVQVTDGVHKKGIRYGDLIPVLVRAVQELADELDAVKNGKKAE